jgi:hypothetical protein
VFSFRTRVLGEDVVDMAWPEDDAFGLDFVCQRGGKRHRVEAEATAVEETGGFEMLAVSASGCSARIDGCSAQRGFDL